MGSVTAIKGKGRTGNKLIIEAEAKLSGDESISLPEEAREGFIRAMKEPFMTVFEEAYKALGEKVLEGKLPEKITITISIKPGEEFSDDDNKPTLH